MKNRLKKFFRDHEAQMYTLVASVATATGVGVILGRKIVKDNKPVMTLGAMDKDGVYKGTIVVLKNGHEIPFFKELPPKQ